jgi:hypothetical protein
VFECECMRKNESECVSVLEELREESRGEEGIRWSGVCVRCECVSV